MIFKQSSCADELFEGMKKIQDESIIAEESKDDQLLIKAMEALDSAAKSFEKAGNKERAKEVTAVMMSLAEGKEQESPEDSESDEVKKVFMFFGFSPEDLGALNLSSSSNGDD